MLPMLAVPGGVPPNVHRVFRDVVVGLAKGNRLLNGNDDQACRLAPFKRLRYAKTHHWIVHY